jgi:hypothetical protein
MLLRNTSKITELELNWVKKGRKKGRVPMIGLTRILPALGRNSSSWDYAAAL